MSIELDPILTSAIAALVLLSHILHPSRRAYRALRLSAPSLYGASVQLQMNQLQSAGLMLCESQSPQWPPMRGVEHRVIAAISKALLVDEAAVVPTASFFDDLRADSLGIVEMVMILEDDFAIQIPEEDIEALRTVQQAIDYVEHALNRLPNPSR